MEFPLFLTRLTVVSRVIGLKHIIQVIRFLANEKRYHHKAVPLSEYRSKSSRDSSHTKSRRELTELGWHFGRIIVDIMNNHCLAIMNRLDFDDDGLVTQTSIMKQSRRNLSDISWLKTHTNTSELNNNTKKQKLSILDAIQGASEYRDQAVQLVQRVERTERATQKCAKIESLVQFYADSIPHLFHLLLRLLFCSLTTFFQNI